MSNVTISGLAAGTALSGSEPFPAVQAGNTVKVTAAQIATYVSASPVLTGNVTLTNILTPASNTNLNITPNGTGSVLLNSTTNIGLQSTTTTLGVGSTDAIMTTQGAYNLILRTNAAATNQGSITINNGANGNIVISPNGTGNVLSTTSIKSNSATGGVGYASGAGGTVTQLTSKVTGVSLSKVCGNITTAADALAGDTTVSFILTNTAIAAGDVMIINHLSGGTIGAYTFNAQCIAGSATINLHNVTTGSLSEALTLAFVVVKAVTA
jgi:hypothetical protein